MMRERAAALKEPYLRPVAPVVSDPAETQLKLRRLLGGVVAAMGLLAVLLLLHPFNPRFLFGVDAAIQVLAPAIAAALCLLGKPLAGLALAQRRVIVLAGLGCISLTLCYTMISGAYVSGVLIAGHTTFEIPELAGVALATCYLCLLLAGFGIVGYPRSGFARIQLLLDTLLLITAASAMSWYYLLGPEVLDARGVLVNVVLAGIPPIGDLVLLLPMALMWLSPGSRHLAPIVRLFWLALGCNVAGDTINTVLTLHDPYSFGTAADVTTPTAILLLGCGAWALRGVRHAPLGSADSPAGPSSLGRLLLPYIGVPLMAFLVLQLINTRPDAALAAGVVAALVVFVTLILLRQLLALLENRQAQVALRRSEERLRAVIDQAPIMFYTIDLRGRCTFAAGRALAAPGGKSGPLPLIAPHRRLRGPVVGESIADTFGAMPELLEVTRQALAGEPGRGTIDDHGVVLDYRMQPIVDAAGRVAEVVGVALDITDAVRARQAAEELADLRSDFVASVSHELRTPLTAILGYAELLQAHWARLGEAQRLKQIGKIAVAAHRQQRLVADLLLLSRAEARDLAPECSATALGPIVEQAAEETRSSYHSQRIVVAGSAELAVLADRERTAQILTNLLDNAAKYSEAGCPIHAGWHVEGEMAAVWVRDGGPGIPMESRSRLFTRFGRIPGSRIRAGRVGTGLGLYLGRSLAEAMGGTLELTTSGPAGSTFTLRLPLAPPDPARCRA